jgi:NAD(P) transhydrogenase
VSLERFDFVVIGAGPAGQKAALSAARAGRSVLLVDRHERVGGECVRRGTIPSKTLRESALYFAGLRQRSPELVVGKVGPGTLVQSLMRRLDAVLEGHERLITAQVRQSGVTFRQGRARLVGPRLVEITSIDGRRQTVECEFAVLATGSRPRNPPRIRIDHEHVLDSDSVLQMIYLPRSMVVLGAGVIACEFATIFQALGVEVTLVDKVERPLGFLDGELIEAFASAFEAAGGRFVPREEAVRVEPRGLGEVEVELGGGELLRAEKVLVALGRTATLSGLGLDAVGLVPGGRGTLTVDACGRTALEWVFAAGDVIGPPALAASSMEQGRRAVLAALGQAVPHGFETTPVGIYTVPELAQVGLTEEQARERHGAVAVGRARFAEIARGHINGSDFGLLKLVAERGSGRLLGAQVAGEGATELVHLAQLALLAGLPASTFVENVFNFPTLAEAYRVAATRLEAERAGVPAAAG